MTKDEVLAQLEAMGTAQNCKVYKRHGVKEPMFGVSIANLNQLKKKIKVNHELAQALWQTGNHDARMLATMIANPKLVDETLVNQWAEDLDSYPLTDSFCGLLNQTGLVRQKAEEWINADDEWQGRCGWHSVSHLAMNDKSLADDYFEPYLTLIEGEIHQRKNRIREAMNNTLIAVGIRNPALQERAMAIARQIGPVAVDHGDTSCKTPDAGAYILKTVQRREKLPAGGGKKNG